MTRHTTHWSPQGDLHVGPLADCNRCAGRTPRRPVDVVIHHHDGTTTPCELAYRGVDDTGMHDWQALTPMGPGERLTVGVLPGRTSISFPDPEEDVR